MNINKIFLKRIVYTVIAVGIFYLALQLLFRPSHDRDWELGHERLPIITYEENASLFKIDNFRNFKWQDDKLADVVYETKEFDLNKITGVDVFISHFDEFEGLAHIFLSFGFSEGENIVVSIETRREVGETFSPLLGILRQFEIIYVVGSEKDIVGVRTDHRDERVYLYKTKASAEQAKNLFKLLSEEINEVNKNPRMYNTLTRNCTNELTRQVEKMSEVDFPLTWKTILPGYFDEVLYELALIDTSLPFSETKKNHQIDNTRVDINSETYSSDLRNLIN